MYHLQIYPHNARQCTQYEHLVPKKASNNYRMQTLILDKFIAVSKKLSWFEKRLPEQMFKRLHRSHFVNQLHVQRLVAKCSSTILLANCDSIEMSRRKKANHNLLTSLLLTFCLLTLNSHAQTYNVGVGGVFTNLTAAVSAYNGMSLTQPVTFLLTDATYNISGVTINKNATANSSRMLTIKPAPGVTVAINGNISTNAVFRIVGDFITIDGSNAGTNSKDLTITNINVTSPRVVYIGGSAQASPAGNVAIRNTKIIGGINTQQAISLCSPAGPTTAGYFNNITIENNTIKKSLYGINVVAASGPFTNGTSVKLLNNDLSSTDADAIKNAGIYISGLSNGCNISNNKIGNLETNDLETDRGIWIAAGCSTVVVKDNIITNLQFTGAGNFAPIGIEIAASPGGSDIIVEGNQVSGISSVNGSASQVATGIYHNAGSPVYIRNNKISNIKNTGYNATQAYGIWLASSIGYLTNNLIWDIGSSSYNATLAAGIFVAGTGQYQLVYNTVNLNSSNVNSNSAALYLSATVSTAGRLDCRNNIFVNRSTNPNQFEKWAIFQANSAAVFSFLNYNNYEGMPLASKNSVDLPDLVALTTAFGQNSNSISVAPVFVSDNDLHLANAGNAALDNKGIPITGIITDIDGVGRSATTPDVGAYEFGEISGAALIINCTIPSNLLCTGSTIQVNYTVIGTPNANNIFTAELSNFQGNYNFGTQQIGSVSSAATSGSITATIPIGAIASNFYRIRVLSSSPAYNGNDNGSPITIIKPIILSITGLTTTMAGVSNPFSVTNTAGSTYLWEFTNGTQLSGTNTNSVTGSFQITGGQQVKVTETNQNGCVGSTYTKAVTVTAPPSTTWTGAASTAWEAAANWSNGVPGATIDVIIPAGMPRYPVISAETSIKSISIQQNASVTLANNIKLILLGHL